VFTGTKTDAHLGPAIARFVPAHLTTAGTLLYSFRMLASCLFCAAKLGVNDQLPTFPVGRRLAFDAKQGRLWVIWHCLCALEPHTPR